MRVLNSVHIFSNFGKFLSEFTFCDKTSGSGGVVAFVFVSSSFSFFFYVSTYNE